MGIEPTLEAWEAPVLPLNYTRRMATQGKISCMGVTGQRVILQLLIHRVQMV